MVAELLREELQDALAFQAMTTTADDRFLSPAHPKLGQYFGKDLGPQANTASYPHFSDAGPIKGTVLTSAPKD